MMNNSINIAEMATAVLLLVAGCSSSPQAKFYTLNNPPLPESAATTTTDRTTVAVKIGPVSIPDALDQPQIVTRTGSNTLTLSEFHRWGGDLRDDLERVLGENIAILLPTNHITLSQEITILPIDFQVIVNIRELGGELGGSVILNADWLIKPSGDQPIVADKSVLRETALSPDYSDFVAAQSRLIARLSREIADAIKQQMTKP